MLQVGPLSAGKDERSRVYPRPTSCVCSLHLIHELTPTHLAITPVTFPGICAINIFSGDDTPASTSTGTSSGHAAEEPEIGTSTPTVSAAAGETPILVLLDMNGTLLYRAKTPLPLPVGAETFLAGDPQPLQYWIRPGASDLVGLLSRHPRARLAFYTSMRMVNALPAARFLLSPDDR